MDAYDRPPADPEVHVAMPRLTGQPAYARPPRPVPPSPRAPDIDDLPLEAYWSDELRAVFAERRNVEDGGADA